MTWSKSFTALVALALLASVLLSGCLEDGDEPPMDGSDDDHGMHADADGPQGNENETGEQDDPDPAENETGDPDDDDGPVEPPKDPPEARLFALSNTTGYTPLTVKFLLSGSVDDNRSLEWSFDPGDGSDPVEGDELETEYEHTYTEAGTFDAVLEVSDGEDTATENMTVETVEPDLFVDVVDEPVPAFMDNGTGLPATVVEAGQAVQWRFLGNGHTVTMQPEASVGDQEPFHSGSVDEGGTFTLELTETGVYTYYCETHQSQGQYALLIVQ